MQPVASTSKISPVSSPIPKKVKRSLKLCIIGNAGVGKTSLRHRYLSGAFTLGYRATIGCDFISKTIVAKDGTQVSLSIWDTAGQERFRSLGASFYRGSDACVLLYDTNDIESLKSLKSWYGEFKERCLLDILEDRDSHHGEEDEQTKELETDSRLLKFAWACAGTKVDLHSEDGRTTAPSGKVAVSEAESFLATLLNPVKSPSDRSRQPEEGYVVDGVAAKEPGGSILSSRPSEDNSTSMKGPKVSNKIINVTSPRRNATLSSPAMTSNSEGDDYHSAQEGSTSILSASFKSDNTIRGGNAKTPAGILASDKGFSNAQHMEGSEDGSRSDGSSGDSDYDTQEEIFAAERDRESRYGVDVYMATSPPRLSEAVLKRHCNASWASPVDELLRQANLKESASFSSLLVDQDHVSRTSDSPFSRRVPALSSPPERPSEQVRSFSPPTHDYRADGIKHFSTSSRTGEGIDDLFEYIIQRVLCRWEEEELELRKNGKSSSVDGAEVIKIGKNTSSNRSKWREACCS